jgi:alcohol dehydrogenase class IV
MRDAYRCSEYERIFKDVARPCLMPGVAAGGSVLSSLARPVTLRFPPSLELGQGTASAVGRWAEAQGCRRVLVVADSFNGDRIDRLGLPGQAVVFDRVKPEPDIANLEALLAVAREAAPDLVVGFGGGSAMDLAKLAAVLHDSEQTLSDVVGAGRVAGRRSALIQVPTTSGTGSECGTRALVTDAANSRKLAVESRHMLADVAVIDPDLTTSVPPAVTAATGVDALAHCVESFTNRKSHPLVDLYAEEGIRLVGLHLARAVAAGDDCEARMGMSLASMYGGLCLGPVNTAAGHAVAYPLGTRFGLPHGLANALIFPYVLAFNAPACPAKTARILDLLGQSGGDAPSEEDVFRLAGGFCRRLGIDAATSVPALAEEDLEAMADEAFSIKRLLDNNPREVGRDDILGMYRHLAGNR